ncbi:MAG: response regulator transcription factor [Xylanivirga thermophila]|jgi:two-component system, OmpR family, response regulator VanR|uniref:response regulator transcription factor n=1 Tax=Xylanivirga thermophila TaxID=2496273 RepID=UPI00101DC508|nr:response regulator transcription factor [Xylanivirga thermophila]
MSGQSILVVDDEKEIADLIEIYLKNDGYNVYKADNGEDALSIVGKYPIHLVILDIMMPGLDGLEVCRRIRMDKNIPIIMLSAKSQDMDKIMGLTTGADDYITKPFNPLELLARVKSQLRRYIYLNPKARIEQRQNADIVQASDITIDKSCHRVYVGDREVNLTPTEFGILLLLASSPNRVFSSEEIFEKVWEERYFESNNTVMVHIRKLREKIEVNPRNPQYIKTVWGVGYKFED